MDKKLNELINIFKDSLKNTKMNLLKSVFLYNKKKKYLSYNWMIKELKSWNMNIKEKKYSSIEEVNKEIINLEYINPTWIDHLLNRLMLNVGKPYFTMPKYKQARFLYTKLQIYTKEVTSDKLIIIEWIKNASNEAYNAIVADEKWFDNVHRHIDRIHTAMHALLRNALDNASINFIKRDNIVALYEKLSSSAIENTQEMSLIVYDKNILEKLNEVRNNGSLAHPNPIQLVPSDIGILFLKDIKSLSEKIIKMSNMI